MKFASLRKRPAAVRWLGCLTLVAALLLAGCTGSQPAPGVGQATPVASVAAAGTATPAVTVAPPSYTRTNVTIDISTTTAKMTITPQRTVNVPIGDGIIDVIIHFGHTVTKEDAGARITTPVSTETWSIEIGAPPSGDTWEFALVGHEPGFFGVEVTHGQQYRPVRFVVNVIPNDATPTPGPAASSQGAVAAAAAAAPTAAAPAATAAVADKQVTLADNGQALTLARGQRLLLNLGDGYDWTAQSGNEAVLSRVAGAAALGPFEGRQPGQTTLSASGDPACRKTQPPCGMPSRTFALQVTVE